MKTSPEMHPGQVAFGRPPVPRTYQMMLLVVTTGIAASATTFLRGTGGKWKVVHHIRMEGAQGPIQKQAPGALGGNSREQPRFEMSRPRLAL